MSFSLHSSTENFGGGRRSASVGSNSRISLSDPEKSSMGLMSRKVSARPCSRNHLKESRWMEMRSGSGRTSSRLAKEKRSRETGRDGKGLLLKQGGCGCRAGARQLAAERQGAQGGRARQQPSVRARADKSNR